MPPPPSRLRRYLVFSLIAGISSSLLIAWVLPFAAFHADGTWWGGRGRLAWGIKTGPWPRDWSSEAWWADNDARLGSPKAGRYFLRPHPLVTTVDFRRIIFVGTMESLPYYRQNPPPPWSAIISSDMHEGFEQVFTVATGWPLRCFRGEHWISWREPVPAPPVFNFSSGQVLTAPSAPTEKLKGLHSFTHHASSAGYVPYMPMWAALLGNVGIFSAVWFAVLFTPGLIVRCRRRSTGRCEGCGYNVAGLATGAPCPECGFTRPAHASSPAPPM